MAYSKNDREKAFSAYRELGSVAKAATATGFPESTIAKWRDKFGWARLVQNEERALAEKPFDQTPYVQEICKQFELTENDGEILNQVKCVEGVCLSVIKGIDVPDVGLIPTNFDSAIRALKICWDTRDKIFSKKENNNPLDAPRVNYIAQVNQYVNQKESVGADITIQAIPGESMVSEQTQDS